MPSGWEGLKAEKELTKTTEAPLVMCLAASRVSQMALRRLICANSATTALRAEQLIWICFAMGVVCRVGCLHYAASMSCTSSILSITRSSICRIGPPAGFTAALLTRMSMCCRPNSRSAACTAGVASFCRRCVGWASA